MMTKVWQRIAMMATFIPVLLLAFSAVAQNATEIDLTTLEELTAESADFIGEEVALEGFVAEFVNVNTLVLGENAGIDDDRILVINNTGEIFAETLFKGSEVRVQGIVYRSLDEHMAMMQEEITAESTPDAEPIATEDADTDMMDRSEITLDFYYGGNLPGDYNAFTVLELSDMDMLAIVMDEDEE